jgi:hypothetical protein
MLAEVTREIDDTRQMIRKAYFKQKLEETLGDARATWAGAGWG